MHELRASDSPLLDSGVNRLVGWNVGTRYICPSDGKMALGRVDSAVRAGAQAVDRSEP